MTNPNHKLVFTNTRYPQDAATTAPLSTSNTYGPLLVLTDTNILPSPLQNYLLDIQPDYDTDPVRGVYSHDWMIDDKSSVSTTM